MVALDWLAVKVKVKVKKGATLKPRSPGRSFCSGGSIVSDLKAGLMFPFVASGLKVKVKVKVGAWLNRFRFAPGLHSLQSRRWCVYCLLELSTRSPPSDNNG